MQDARVLGTKLKVHLEVPHLLGSQGPEVENLGVRIPPELVWVELVGQRPLEHLLARALLHGGEVHSMEVCARPKVACFHEAPLVDTPVFEGRKAEGRRVREEQATRLQEAIPRDQHRFDAPLGKEEVAQGLVEDHINLLGHLIADVLQHLVDHDDLVRPTIGLCELRDHLRHWRSLDAVDPGCASLDGEERQHTRAGAHVHDNPALKVGPVLVDSPSISARARLVLQHRRMRGEATEVAEVPAI
mmetsp:Transcript_92121/g.204560  ORF Transcript_92121/g.204560 Transcript_92121/m.204560 type:complete len:245 (-) Transcript_92121:387-1121(-)